MAQRERENASLSRDRGFDSRQVISKALIWSVQIARMSFIEPATEVTFTLARILFDLLGKHSSSNSIGFKMQKMLIIHFDACQIFLFNSFSHETPFFAVNQKIANAALFHLDGKNTRKHKTST